MGKVKINIYREAAEKAAELASSSPVMDTVARQLATKTKALALTDGAEDYAKGVRVVRKRYVGRFSHTVVDRMVMVENGRLLEVGHIATSNTRAVHPKKKHGWVPGKWYLTKAAKKVPSTRKKRTVYHVD